MGDDKRLPPYVVPREMLDLCRNVLRISLARGLALQDKLELAEKEIDALKRRLREL